MSEDDECQACGHERSGHDNGGPCQVGAYLDENDHCDCRAFVEEKTDE